MDSCCKRLKKRTAAEFKEARDEVFVKYFDAVLSVSNLARVIVPQAAIDRLTWESFSETEADLRDEGLSRFGATARDQAIFTVWTLRKINALVSRIAAAPPLSNEHKALDRKLVTEFSFHSAWAQFISIAYSRPFDSTNQSTPIFLMKSRWAS